MASASVISSARSSLTKMSLAICTWRLMSSNPSIVSHTPGSIDPSLHASIRGVAPRSLRFFRCRGQCVLRPFALLPRIFFLRCLLITSACSSIRVAVAMHSAASAGTFASNVFACSVLRWAVRSTLLSCLQSSLHSARRSISSGVSMGLIISSSNLSCLDPLIFFSMRSAFRSSSSSSSSALACMARSFPWSYRVCAESSLSRNSLR
mmetsp:Transcript_24700/g.59894  ORF Transcript_24700/g.59894 Transcript_24700/m.59894 type:complete len:207 (+) Transcript_24700:4972-5592(+)